MVCVLEDDVILRLLTYRPLILIDQPVPLFSPLSINEIAYVNGANVTVSVKSVPSTVTGDGVSV